MIVNILLHCTTGQGRAVTFMRCWWQTEPIGTEGSVTSGGVKASLLQVGGGGELRSGGVKSNCEKLRENCGKIAENCGKIAEKLQENCDVVSSPPEASRCNSSGQVAQNSQNFTETNSPWAVQLQEAPLDITVELQHEPKAADVVIQFVLPL